jgi:hypothetical protein
MPSQQTLRKVDTGHGGWNALQLRFVSERSVRAFSRDSTEWLKDFTRRVISFLIGTLTYEDHVVVKSN